MIITDSMCELYNIFEYLYNSIRHTALYLWLNLKTIYYVTCNNSACSHCCWSIALACKFFYPHGQKDKVDTEYSGSYSCHHLALKCIRAFGFVGKHNRLKLQSQSLQPADYLLIAIRKQLVFSKQFSVEPNPKKTKHESQKNLWCVANNPWDYRYDLRSCIICRQHCRYIRSQTTDNLWNSGSDIFCFRNQPGSYNQGRIIRRRKL